jgi:thiol-disulfide isomerase/thioredoxin
MNERLSPLRGDVVWVAVSLGIVVLVCAVAVGVLLSVLKSRFDGRFRGTRLVRHSGAEKARAETVAVDETPDANVARLTAEDIGDDLGPRATLLQFSSAFCAPCRATRRTLAEVESMVDGVRHIELDAESHLDLVRRLDILRTPTVLVLDSTGAIVTRASGQPRKPDVIAALGTAVDRQPH